MVVTKEVKSRTQYIVWKVGPEGVDMAAREESRMTAHLDECWGLSCGGKREGSRFRGGPRVGF